MKITKQRFVQILKEEIENVLTEGVLDKGILKAVFMAGGPGSGKTFVTMGLFGIPDETRVSSKYDLKTVNSDSEFSYLLNKFGFGTDLDNMPEDLFSQLTGTAKDMGPGTDVDSGLRKFAKNLTKERMRQYINGRLGMIIDGTADNYKKVKKQRKELEAKGYDTYMVFVHCDLKTAQARNKARPRVLPSELVEDSWHKVQKNMVYFQGLFGNSNYLMVDNSKILSEKQATKKFNMLFNKGLDKFITKPVKNKIGKKWIEKQKILIKNKKRG